MKRLLRLIIKIIATPVVLLYFALMIPTAYVFQFFSWLWEDYYVYQIDVEVTADEIQKLKRWFTTI
jgi:hypothetical protein